MAVPRHDSRSTTPGPLRPRLHLVTEPVDLDARTRETADDDRRDSNGEALLAPWTWSSDEKHAFAELDIPITAAEPCEAFEQIVDASTDVHDAAVTNIEVALLRRYLRQLAPVDSKVLRLVWGIGCVRHSLDEAADRAGLTAEGVEASLRRAMHELRISFGVADGNCDAGADAR